MSTCKTCRHWEADHNADAACGECHRNPPTASATPTRSWPTTFKSDYCGEWKDHPGALSEFLEHIPDPEHNDEIRRAILRDLKRSDYVDRIAKEAPPGPQWPNLEDIYNRMEERYGTVLRSPWSGENPKGLCWAFYEELRKMMGDGKK